MLQAVAFYITYPVIYLVAHLPFGVMYALSDVLSLLFRLSGYRRKVVWTNLRNSFPDKTDAEIDVLCLKYFKYLCDLILETLSTMAMTEADYQKRCKFHAAPWLDDLYQKKQSFIIVMGHHGNWEWAGPSFTLNTKHQLVVIYRPLSNPYFERMLVKMRTRFGTRITPVKDTLRDMVSNRNQITATAFIADQTATPDHAYWMHWLNQDTAVFTGPGKLAVKFKYPVVYINVTRPRRGYYEFTPELLFEDVSHSTDEEILLAFNRRLEKEIIRTPEIWLWSHKRWKHKRPQTVS